MINARKATKLSDKRVMKEHKMAKELLMNVDKARQLSNNATGDPLQNVLMDLNERIKARAVDQDNLKREVWLQVPDNVDVTSLDLSIRSYGYKTARTNNYTDMYAEGTKSLFLVVSWED